MYGGTGSPDEDEEHLLLLGRLVDSFPPAFSAEGSGGNALGHARNSMMDGFPPLPRLLSGIRGGGQLDEK